MLIKHLNGISGARHADGFVIIADVMRAATVEAYALGKGVKYLIPVATKDEAFKLKIINPNLLLMGEEEGYKIKGFDLGNSPSELLRKDVKDKIIVHRTSSGTQGLVNAISAKELIFGSFVTVSAIVRYVRKQNFKKISIVSMDSEDIIFSNLLESLLKGSKLDIKKLKEQLYKDPGIDWFLDPSKPEFPKEDVEHALKLDKFNFICIVKKDGKQLMTTKLVV